MKTTMTFRFTETECTVESATGYYFCELGYDCSAQDVQEADASGNLAYLMTRDFHGQWKIVSCGSALPEWIFDYEVQFGEAIDESLGIQAVNLELKAR